MTTKTPGSPAKPPLGSAPSAYYRLHALLRSVRCIAQHEDALCELLHEAEATGLSGALTLDLLELIQQLPAQDYLHDLASVAEILHQPPSVTSQQPSRSAVAPATQKPARKRSSAGKTKQGEKGRKLSK